MTLLKHAAERMKSLPIFLYSSVSLDYPLTASTLHHNSHRSPFVPFLPVSEEVSLLADLALSPSNLSLERFTTHTSKRTTSAH